MEAFDSYGYLFGEISVSNQDDSNTRNNTVHIRSSVKMSPVDLTVNVTDGDAPFVSSPDGKAPGGEWEIVVHNVGTESSSGTTSVNVSNGRIFTGGPLSASGEGWACEAQGIAIICTNDTPVPPGGSLPTLVVAVGAFKNYGILNGEIYVFNPGDGNGWNNMVGLLTPVALGGSVDLTINIDDVDQLGETAGELRYRLVVDNVGGAATTDPISVSFPDPSGRATLPGGLAKASGSGWDCDQSRPQSRYGGNYGGVCTTSQVAEAGGRLPPIEVTGTLPRHDLQTVIAEAEVDQSEDAAASGNNYVRLTTPVRPSPVDLVVNLTDGGSPFVANRSAEYRLIVRNVGSAASSGAIRVSYPAFTNGMTASGSGWVCQAQSGTEYGGICTTARRVAPGTSLPPIIASAPVSAGVVGGTYRGSAAVENALDGNSGNDAAFVETPIAATAPTTSGVTYLALGDSYSAGEGLGPYLPGTDLIGLQATYTNRCHRSADAYGPKIARDRKLTTLHLNTWAKHNFAACSGAITHDYFAPNSEGNRISNGAPEPAQKSSIERVPGRVGTVTLTFGGNDVGFADILRECIYDQLGQKPPPRCSKNPEIAIPADLRIDALAGRPSGAGVRTTRGHKIHSIQSIITDILSKPKSKDAHIYVMGYPKLFGNRTEAFWRVDHDPIISIKPVLVRDRACRVGGVDVIHADPLPVKGDSVFIAPEDVSWLNDQAVKLNRAIQTGVDKFKGRRDSAGHRLVTFVPVLLPFKGHGLCDTSTPWINKVSGTADKAIADPVQSITIDPGSFHPKRDGQQHGYEKALLSTNIGRY